MPPSSRPPRPRLKRHRALLRQLHSEYFSHSRIAKAPLFITGTPSCLTTPSRRLATAAPPASFMGCREKSHALRAAPFGKGSLPGKYGFHFHIKFGLMDHAVHVLSAAQLRGNGLPRRGASERRSVRAMRERINYLHCLSPRGQRIATVRRTEVSAESWTTGADVCYFFDLKSKERNILAG